MKGRPACPCPPPHSPAPHRDKGPDFKKWHCKMEHGFGFCFLIEDEMKKTLVTAGRRLITIFGGFLFACFLSFQEGAIVFEEIFWKYL